MVAGTKPISPLFSLAIPEASQSSGNSRQRNLFVGAGVVWHF
jgi:hypothetical protein